MDVTIERNTGIPIYKQIYHDLKGKILSEELTKGYKLPSERKLADTLGIHRNTVIKAYQYLIADGLVESSVSPRGYFVVYQSHGLTESFKNVKKKYPNTLHYMLKEQYLLLNDLFYELFYNNESSSHKESIISFASDVIMPSEKTKKRLDELTISIVKNPEYDIYGFQSSQGNMNLRKSIVELLEKKNISAMPSQVQIVSETYEAIQLISRLFLYPGDTVLVEEPIPPDMVENFQLMNLKIISIPMDKNGMKTDCLPGLIENYHPKFIYTVPSFHYPTGYTMSLERRYELLDISYQYDIPIIEEDCDSAVRFEGNNIPSLKSLDQTGSVIYISSFIMSICPGIRIAYMLAPQNIIKSAARIVENTQIFKSPINQFLVTEFINKGYIYESIEEIKEDCKEKRDLLCSELKKVPDIDFKFTVPHGGSSLWCYVEESLNSKELLKNAWKVGVSYTPGDMFFPFSDAGNNYFRLCYGNINLEDIPEGVSRLAEAIRLTR